MWEGRQQGCECLLETVLSLPGSSPIPGNQGLWFLAGNSHWTVSNREEGTRAQFIVSE